MSSFEFNTNGDKNLQQSSEPTLCANECGFFGAEATHGLCSKCYKEFIKTVTPQAIPSVALSVKATPDPVPPVELEKNLSVAMTSLSLNAAKKNRCVKCNKKVGLLGFQCRCGNTFCGLHRYAEEHECDFDYKAKGRRELLKANPGVSAAKLEKL